MKPKHLAAVLAALALTGCSILPSPGSLANMLRPGTSETTIVGLVELVAERLDNGDVEFTVCRSSNERSMDALCADAVTVTVPRVLKDEVADALLLIAGQSVEVTGDGNMDELEARAVIPGRRP